MLVKIRLRWRTFFQSMLLKRIITLLTSLSLLMALIVSAPTSASDEDRARAISSIANQGVNSPTISATLKAGPAIGSATLTAKIIAPSPVLLVSAILLVCERIGHVVKQSVRYIGPAPPFLASAFQNIHLRIRVLLI